MPKSVAQSSVGSAMAVVLLWLILFVLCFPLALAVLLLYPLIWLVLLPFRILGIAVEGALGLVRELVLLPVRWLGGGLRTGRSSAGRARPPRG
jgi:hypothetical protein